MGGGRTGVEAMNTTSAPNASIGFDVLCLDGDGRDHLM